MDTFVLTFKDYEATCSFSPDEDDEAEKPWHGELIGVAPRVSFRAAARENLLAAFIAACDDYEAQRPDRGERGDVPDPRG
jgi:predicted HicB family RNase H-like nuclease